MSQGREGISSIPEEEREIVNAEVHVEEEIVDDTPAAEEPKEPESAEESVRRALAEAQAEENANSEGKPAKVRDQGAPTVKAEKVKIPGAIAPSKQQAAPEDLTPPARLSVPEKEVFNRLPPELKPAVARMFKEHEALNTKTQMEARRVIDENRSIMEAVKPYVPEWNERNLTTPQAIAGLAAAHKKLTDPNPAVRRAKWLEIGASIGEDPSTLAALREEGGVAPQAASSAPEYQALQNELNNLRSQLSGFVQQQQDATIAPVVQEGQAVANETDASGRYLYPELHDAEVLQSRIRPLVSAMAQAIPDLSYGELLKRAVFTIRGDQGNLGYNTQARPQPANRPTINTQQRAQLAASSVRGRTASGVSSGSLPNKIPVDVHDSVRLALDNLRRGIS